MEKIKIMGKHGLCRTKSKSKKKRERTSENTDLGRRKRNERPRRKGYWRGGLWENMVCAEKSKIKKRASENTDLGEGRGMKD
jgi:hypothetical protein